ncbi:hypothetical protein EMPS_00468 [Entomortierella parvispora]|uniref:Nudix hydrolase domain-containing protein n=1 Tax=Entomortierella parvispora TaxID=205924 RepID=A0A9P3LRW1_9FUNG|nr:hypothetical protein EMPS_00468 [Entomortierella parvispora]
MAASIASMSSRLGRQLTFGWRHAGASSRRSQIRRSASHYSQHSGFATTFLCRSDSGVQTPSEPQDFNCEAINFPGGKRDPSDKTILETALREMQEEISISPEQVEVLGEYSAMPSKGCTMKVHPFVGFIKEPIEDISLVKHNESEVQKVFTVPIKDLVSPEKRSMVQFRNSKFLYPVWKVEEENITIWGLTAFILDGILRCIAKEGPTQFQEIPEGSKVDQYRPAKPSAFV